MSVHVSHTTTSSTKPASESPTLLLLCCCWMSTVNSYGPVRMSVNLTILFLDRLRLTEQLINFNKRMVLDWSIEPITSWLPVDTHMTMLPGLAHHLLSTYAGLYIPLNKENIKIKIFLSCLDFTNLWHPFPAELIWQARKLKHPKPSLHPYLKTFGIWYEQGSNPQQPRISDSVL